MIDLCTGIGMAFGYLLAIAGILIIVRNAR